MGPGILSNSGIFINFAKSFESLIGILQDSGNLLYTL